ncbi:MAG: shikimate dehydrogenase [Chloroflexi bacterium]|nr:shikimate dehydrogenase [Chloroflexota bacterium]
MTKTVGIIGYPLGHSISPAFQQAALNQLGLDIKYEAWETPPERLAWRLGELRRPDCLGGNVTIPHKEAVLSLLDEVDSLARDIGAVNTIVSRGGRLSGYNTDAPGFLRALKEDGGCDPRGKRALLLGAGGAARAVALALAEAGVWSIAIANRTPPRARGLAAALAGRAVDVAAIAWSTEALREALAACPLVVNCTSLGMRHGPGEGESPLPAALTRGGPARRRTPRLGDILPKGALFYDLVYNPPMTPFLREAEEAGARILGGLPMLVYQGAESFRLWTGREAPVEVMMRAARHALKGDSP